MAGPDICYPRKMKVKNKFVQNLTALFNKAFATGKASKDWKFVNRTLIFEEG